MKNVFIIGSKGIPANYGGFETFVDELVSRQQNKNIKYHVACLSDNDNETEYHGAHCFNVKVPNIGPAKAVYYDLAALKYCVKYIKDNNINDAIVYILACRIGLFVSKYVKQLHKLNCKVYVNPDGHEWKRAKWNYFIRKYWKLSEKLMVKHADLLICDSKNIEKYIQEDYKQYSPKTTFIAYGADTSKSTLRDDDEKLLNWYKEKGVQAKEYYLVVGRFVPENNYETMIKEFMKSNTKKDFVLITNVEQNKFYETLKNETHFDQDKRIKFVGTVYDQQLLKKIRENAYGYLHGHEVGGTNPSLLEALATTDLNLLLDVGFNKEVGEDGAVYWNKQEGNLSGLINGLENISNDQLKELSTKAKHRIDSKYSWDYIVRKYENYFEV
ncbi:beta 1-4 rhamnosyltransferase Cps2T [Massilimicrobiota sp. SW1139]|uniref:beta 1-4 rhamnosyltransferase Cps2T n=1 Tax=Massilimicrobiota sp. SW1139 TaxID=2530043 RepID=UPI00143C39A0|nr:glycosyltransferase family 1 protein [Massilimicrobiota sp. SW1139]NJE45722.1 glycosyltransferase family 1 protein [Massilimicrobiota sp. SW1139]